MTETAVSSSSPIQPGDKFQLRVTVGDRNGDGKVDVTLQVYAGIPVFHPDPIKVVDVTLNVPAEQVVPVLTAMMGTVVTPLLAGNVMAVGAKVAELLPKR